MHDDHFIRQARSDYAGTPQRIARCSDRYDEQHVIIEMRLSDGSSFWLDWIGAELAPEPDEFDVLPFPDLNWTSIPA